MATIRLWEFALQEILLFVLGNVEFGTEGAHSARRSAYGEEVISAESALSVLVKVVEHAEEGGEAGVVRAVAGIPERHFIVVFRENW